MLRCSRLRARDLDVAEVCAAGLQVADVEHGVDAEGREETGVL